MSRRITVQGNVTASREPASLLQQALHQRPRRPRLADQRRDCDQVLVPLRPAPEGLDQATLMLQTAASQACGGARDDG